jgi:uncharacterized 2Fe-2S/4Fe-4S cluster protein (DUF4445 family)
VKTLKKNDEKYVHIISRNKTEPAEGETLLALLRRMGLEPSGSCGGNGTCGKCRIKIEGTAAAAQEAERRILSEEEICSGIRLACHTDAVKGMTVSVCDGWLQTSPQITDKGSPPSHKEAGERSFSIALDIGTTTIVAYLVDRDSGTVTAVSSAGNPQTLFGADVVSRIAYASAKENGLNILKSKVIDAVNCLIFTLRRRAYVAETDITEVVVAANTTMEHIFAGVSPASIGKAPFIPPYRIFPPLDAEQLGLVLSPGTTVRLLPNISGFVGGDITAGILYTRITSSKDLSLLIDIGTNNEMVLGCSDFLLCCSSAAGPALEGARISQGMSAFEGAVNHVRLENGKVVVSTVDDAPAKGICGSGLLDTTVMLLSEKIIDRSGKIGGDVPAGSPLTPLLDKKLKRFLISEGRKGGIYVTQKDIRELQLAKSAITTGVEIMLSEAGKRLEDIDRVFLAGAFGNYLDIENAERAGILPPLPAEKITSVGNSSGLGAIELILRPDQWKEAARIIKAAKHIELATHRDFPIKFVHNLSFR